MEAGAHDRDELLARARRLLGDDVEPLDELADHRSLVVLARSGAEQVVIKQHGEPERHAAEVAMLLAAPPGVAPRVVAHDEACVVLEDLGDGPSVAALLLGSDAPAARSALTGWARSLATLVRPSLGLTVPDGSAIERWTAPLAAFEPLQALADGLGVSIDRGTIEEEVHGLVDALAEPGSWLAHAPGDACPDNNRVLPDGRVVLFDFEFAGWRHAAFEAAYARTPFPSCWCASALPADLADELEEVFLDALDPPDRSGFRRATAQAAVGQALAAARWISAAALEPDDRPGVPSSLRQKLLLRLDHLRSQDLCPALADAAAGLAAALVERSPGLVLPIYPAFAGRST